MNRRKFLCGFLAAPAIVAVGNIMPVRAIAALRRPVQWTVSAVPLSVPNCVSSIASAFELLGDGDSVFVSDGHVETLPIGGLYLNDLYGVNINFNGARLERSPLSRASDPYLTIGSRTGNSIFGPISPIDITPTGA